MPSRHRCYLLTATDNIVVTLRRFGYATPCGRREPRYPGADLVTYDVHDIEAEVTRSVGTLEASLDGDRTLHTYPHDDPRWPARCSCGYAFTPEDKYQECHTRLYRRSDTGELVTISNAPVGALYDSGTFKDVDGYQRNGDRMSLMCKTPAGEWMIDGPASNGPGWTRTGTPPNIDVTPSIGIGNPQRMHGWLRNGWLEIDNP
jgi:hypothetical protein